MIRRYLEWTGVDVDLREQRHRRRRQDHQRAAERGTTESDLAATYEQAWFDAMDWLGVRRPDHVPHATEYIDGMLELIAELIDRGHAYAAEDGVYFDVDSFPGYGALPHRTLEELRESAGARVEIDEAKREPDGLRAVEGRQARRARMGLAVGQGAAGLAHRVLGDGARPVR